MNNKNNESELRLSQLMNIDKEDTVENLLKALRNAKIKSAKADTVESITNSSQLVRELTLKLAHKARQTSNLQEKLDILQETKNAPELIKGLKERRNELELKERIKKLTGLPVKSTTQTLLDLEEAKNKVRHTKSMSELRKSLDHLIIAIQVVFNKMQESKGDEKLHLYRKIHRANEFLKTYNNILSKSKRELRQRVIKGD